MKILKNKAILMVLGLMLGAGAALGVTIVFGESLGIAGKPGETKIQYIEKHSHDPKDREEVLSVYFADFIIQ